MITEVDRRDPKTNQDARILVEEDPKVGISAGPDADGWEKLYFDVTGKTRVFVRRGDGRVARSTPSDLMKGRRVDAWHRNAAVAESYPGQTTASEIVISPARVRP